MSYPGSEQSGPDCPFSFSVTWLALSSIVIEFRPFQIYVSASSVQAPVSVPQGIPQLLSREGPDHFEINSEAKPQIFEVRDLGVQMKLRAFSRSPHSSAKC